jgi:hypothetical protein
MAVVRSDRIGVPAGLNERRELAWLRSCADDALAGRVVWSVASLPDGHTAGRRLRELLHDSTEVAPMGVEAAEAALGEAIDFLDRGAGADRVALAWTSLLGDIVEEDRTDHVGGTIQVRPVVAAR